MSPKGHTVLWRTFFSVLYRLTTGSCSIKIKMRYFLSWEKLKISLRRPYFTKKSFKNCDYLPVLPAFWYQSRLFACTVLVNELFCLLFSELIQRRAVFHPKFARSFLSQPLSLLRVMKNKQIRIPLICPPWTFLRSLPRTALLQSVRPVRRHQHRLVPQPTHFFPLVTLNNPETHFNFSFRRETLVRA